MFNRLMLWASEWFADYGNENFFDNKQTELDVVSIAF
jgi:hypothetical protein